jgi:hypothetical protein
MKMLLPSAEAFLKSKRGATLEEVEKEGDHDYKKAKDAAIRGILHGYILKDYKGTSFEEKFKDYMFTSGTEVCEWIGKTDYASYFNAIMNQFSMLVMNKDAIKYIIDYLNKSTRNRTQAIITLIFTKPEFFKDLPNFDEKTIDDHIEVFKSLSAIVEKMFKLIYAIINKHWTMQTPPNLDIERNFYKFWNAVKNDAAFSVLTKAVPDTIAWNASKHGGCSKSVNSKRIEFTSNDGTIVLTYSQFISRVRELYACTVALVKISLMITLNLKIF